MLRDGAVAAIASSSGDNRTITNSCTAINDRKERVLDSKAIKSSAQVRNIVSVLALD